MIVNSDVPVEYLFCYKKVSDKLKEQLFDYWTRNEYYIPSVARAKVVDAACVAMIGDKVIGVYEIKRTTTTFNVDHFYINMTVDKQLGKHLLSHRLHKVAEDHIDKMAKRSKPNYIIHELLKGKWREFATTPLGERYWSKLGYDVMINNDKSVVTIKKLK